MVPTASILYKDTRARDDNLASRIELRCARFTPSSALSTDSGKEPPARSKLPARRGNRVGEIRVANRACYLIPGSSGDRRSRGPIGQFFALVNNGHGARPPVYTRISSRRRDSYDVRPFSGIGSRCFFFSESRKRAFSRAYTYLRAESA